MLASGSFGRSDGSWTSGASGASAPATVKTAGSGLVVDPDERRRPLRGVLRLGDDQRDGFAVVLDLAGGDDRPVLELRSEARHGLRQVGGGEDEMDAGHRERRGRVDRDRAGRAPRRA